MPASVRWIERQDHVAAANAFSAMVGPKGGKGEIW
jgi:hypothetical protein